MFDDLVSRSRDLNRLIDFLAVRDLSALTLEGFQQVSKEAGRSDVLILLGGITTPDFAATAAAAWKMGVADHFLIVGGAGHSTENLRRNIALDPAFRSISVKARAEADILCDLLTTFFEIAPNDLILENRSTNCGNNATFARSVLQERGIHVQSAIIVQDPIMQRRSLESFRFAWKDDKTRFFGFAPDVPLLGVNHDGLCFANPLHSRYYGMRSFLELVMGEIPRLRDDEDGYGPRGKNFIGHVDIPAEVEEAFSRIVSQAPELVRAKWGADPSKRA